MPKTIKIPLEMKNGEKATDMKSLIANFDVESVVGYFLDGKLKKWLDDRWYEEKAEKVSQLEKDDPALAAKLCEILGVPYEAEVEIDTEELTERKERLSHLKQLTDDEEILRNIDSVAFDQEELAELYDKGVQKIYLCEGDFHIPKSKQELEYVLVADATVEGLVKKENPKVENVKAEEPSTAKPTQALSMERLQNAISIIKNEANRMSLCVYEPRVPYSSDLLYCDDDIHSKSDAKRKAESVVSDIRSEVESAFDEMVSKPADELYKKYTDLLRVTSLSNVIQNLDKSVQKENASVLNRVLEKIDPYEMQDKFLACAEEGWRMCGRLKSESYYYGKIEYSEHDDIMATGFFKKKVWRYDAHDAFGSLRDDVQKIAEKYKQCVIKCYKQGLIEPLLELLSQIKC